MTTPAQPTMLDSSPPTDVGEPVLSPVVAARDSVQRHLRPGARLDLNDTITFLPFEFLMAMLDTHFRDEGQAFVAQDVQTALRDRGQSHAERTTALEALARYYMTTLIVPLRQVLRTPAPSDHPSRDLSEFDEARIEELYQATRNSQSSLHRLVCLRQGYRCPATNHYDIRVAGTPFYTDAVQAAVWDQELDYQLEAAHIVPHKLNTTSGVTTQEHRNSTWSLLRALFPQLPDLANNNINLPLNAILLDGNAHADFGSFKCGFRATDQPGIYDLVRFSRLRPNSKKVDPKRVDLNPVPGFSEAIGRRQHGRPLADYEPSPALLRLHFAVCNVLHASGAAETIDKWYDDWAETRVLAHDGTSDLSFVAARLQASTLVY